MKDDLTNSLCAAIDDVRSRPSMLEFPVGAGQPSLDPAGTSKAAQDFMVQELDGARSRRGTAGISTCRDTGLAGFFACRCPPMKDAVNVCGHRYRSKTGYEGKIADPERALSRVRHLGPLGETMWGTGPRLSRASTGRGCFMGRRGR